MFRVHAYLRFLLVVMVMALFSVATYAVEGTLPADVLYEEVSPSVVSISAQRSGTVFGGGSGTGFVYDAEGHIITNYHVIDGADEIIVAFIDGTLVRATVIGLDADSDQIGRAHV